jgi:hypothetical protein
VAAGGTGKPQRWDQHRYEALAGSREERLTYYLVRRYLHFSIDEWDRLPWWQTKLYIERLSEELRGHPDNAEPAPRAVSAVAEPVEGEDELVTMVPLTAMGANVVPVQFG